MHRKCKLFLDKMYKLAYIYFAQAKSTVCPRSSDAFHIHTNLLYKMATSWRDCRILFYCSKEF